MGLYKARREQAEMAAREAAGESLWTSEFDERARTKIRYAMEHADDSWSSDYVSMSSGRYPFALARHLIVESLGDSGVAKSSPRDGVLRLVLRGDSDEVASAIEAFVWALDDLDAPTREAQVEQGRFPDLINDMLDVHRVSFDLIEGHMVPFDSKEMHEAVVAPTLRLLAGRAGWVDVEAAYQDALGEIADGKAADAITDAGRALQTALEQCGAEGNALGPLIKDARKQGMLGPHDTNLTSGIESLMHWVSAERSEMGEAHKAGTNERADAWLAVHVVGALILRLAEGPRT